MKLKLYTTGGWIKRPRYRWPIYLFPRDSYSVQLETRVVATSRFSQSSLKVLENVGWINRGSH